MYDFNALDAFSQSDASHLVIIALALIVGFLLSAPMIGAVLHALKRQKRKD